ncbi:chitinase [Fusarium heterosporum]|uniref:Chitinase n=1 Tax=Fusarium heterosporum TaxID=42747 RepID=A0A8H5WE09_FUSHE|nr:chitinase [Fusarium heterosporum]
MVSHKLWAAITLSIPLVSALPDLRIMPLGDSITKGSGSTGTIGYRGPLRQKLLSKGANDDITVDMIGTLQHGSMVDNNHEGHSGEYLADINRYWKQSIEARPNVVLVHAGTNNMDKNRDLDIALDLMTSIIDGIFKNAPDVTILVAPVIWANKPAMQANTNRFNPQVRDLIKLRQSQGKQILAVEIDITTSDLSDLKHPNDRGYEKMASAWLDAILDADSRGWLKSPVKINVSDHPGMGLGWSGSNGGGAEGPHTSIWQKKGTVFEGFRTWESVGPIRGAVEFATGGNVILADLNGDGIADYIIAEEDGTVRAWINGGKANDWTSIGKVNPAWESVKGNMIRLADVDNDGKADLIVLYSDGAAKVWRNTGNGKFTSLDSKWATGLAAKSKIHFEDIDGDGYADYVIMESNGATKWARNTHNNGKDNSKKNWEDVKSIAPGPAGMPLDRARLHDIDGDGKADYLIVYNGGAVKALRNTIGDGDRNWYDLGTIAPGISGVTGDMIRFADMDGDGLADFLALADDGSIRMWKNLGIVGSKGQSIHFADLTGDGKDDIISVDARGRARAWLNKGADTWQPMGEIAPGFDEDLSSARVEFADVNGDKKADYLIIYGGGSVKAFLNNGNLPEPGDKRIWQAGIVISPGVGEPGSKVRFADLDGDGYADFLILYDGGAVKYWQNNQNIPAKNGDRIWKDGFIVATGVGEPGSKVRFADLTGDGKADYIIQYDGGAARGYRNNGNIPSGSGRKWNDMGTIAGGVSPQGPVQYADLDGDGKADYLVTFAGGSINAYINNYDWKDPLPGEDKDDKDDKEDEDDDKDEDEEDNDGWTCDPKKTKYGSPPEREGEYKSYSGALRGLQYFTVVNLTPYKFVYDADSSNSYQMTKWDFGDIEPGTARQNVARYDIGLGTNEVDDKGEAYYTMEGTSKSFVVQARTNIDDEKHPWRVIWDLQGMDAGQREMKCPGDEIAVTLVITGSVDKGFMTSIKSPDQYAWMNSIYDTIKDRKLKDVIVPGTHDAGMSYISGKMGGDGTKFNTQTQGLNVRDQLYAGSRWFDLRPITVHKQGDATDYEFWISHMSLAALNWHGNTGESFQEVIDHINEFTSENKGEVIVLQLRQLFGIYPTLNSKRLPWNKSIKDEFFVQLKKINNRCGNLHLKPNNRDQKNMQNLKISQLMHPGDEEGKDKGEANGCVIIMIDEGSITEGGPLEKDDVHSRGDGIYLKSDMQWVDAWPEKTEVKSAAEKAVDMWSTKKADDKLWVGQWVVTETLPVRGIAWNAEVMNSVFPWRAINTISPTANFPSVFLIDYIGVFVQDETDWNLLSFEAYVMAVGLNLFTLSESCDINPHRRPPLYDAPRGGSNRFPSTEKFKKWDGVIYANGTRLEEAPSGLRLGCAPTLKKGTAFGNGTVLMSDIPNPRCVGQSGHHSVALPTVTTEMEPAMSTFSTVMRVVTTTNSIPVVQRTPGTSSRMNG